MVVFLTKSSTSFGKSDAERVGANKLPAQNIMADHTATTFVRVGRNDDVFDFHDS